MWIAPAGKFTFNTVPILIICLITGTDVKGKKTTTTSAPSWTQSTMTTTTSAPSWTQSTMTSPSSLSYTSVPYVVPGTSVAIVLSVIVVLLIIAIGLYLFLKWKQNKHAQSATSNTDHLNNRQLEHTAEDYEEIKDYRFRPDQQTICNNVKVATDSSDSSPELEHTAEKFDEIKDTEYHPDLYSTSIDIEAPADPSDPPADLTQSHEYTQVNFVPNLDRAEPENASNSAAQEINE